MDNVTTFPRRTFRMRRNQVAQERSGSGHALRGAEPEDDRDDQQGTPLGRSWAVHLHSLFCRTSVLGLWYGH